MKYIILCFLSFIMLSCGNSESNKSTSGTEAKIVKSTIDLSLNGEELFAKHCKLCHGIKGNLQLNGAKDLKESVLTLEERVILITNGKNAMTPFKNVLSKEEIEKVADYSQTFSKK